MPTEPEAHGAEPTSVDAPVSPPADEPVTAPVGAPADPRVGPNGDTPVAAAPPAPPPEPGRRSRRRTVAWVVTALALAFVLGASFVPLPYYLFQPGSVRDTEPLISVKGTRTYETDGAIGYTTVSLRQARLFGLMRAWVDDDIDVVKREDVLQGRDVEQNQQLNLQMMVNSKQVATQVALEQLGFQVDVTVGQLVDQVVPDSPADGVLEPGDTIVAVDGQRFDDPDDLGRALEGKAPGEKVTVTVRPASGQAEEKHELTLAPSPDDPDKGVMGVRIVPVAIDYDFPIDIAIDTGNVGGPSAGLAFTLGIIDTLTPGSLTGGHDVAVTGTINADGTVGPIGGSAQKAAAVRDKGIKLFLVPRADYKDAAAHSGKSLKVVAIDDLDDALRVLAREGGNGLDLPQIGKQDADAA
jgi:PDZ domain-containing protein